MRSTEASPQETRRTVCSFDEGQPCAGQRDQPGTTSAAQDTDRQSPEKAAEDEGRELQDRSASEDVDSPSDRIVDFDWSDLESRYHRRMQEAREEERKIQDEFDRLLQVRAIPTVFLTGRRI